MDFEVKESRVENGVMTLSVEVTSDAVEEAYRSVRRELSRFVRIPGFRAGKAPLAVLANHVGRERLDREVERELLPRFYYEAVEQLGTRPVSPVRYEEKTLEKGKPFLFKAVVNVAPDVEIGDYHGLEIEHPEVAAVTDQAVEERLEDLRFRVARTKVKEGPAENGDLAVVQLQGKVGDQAFRSLSQKNLSLHLGKDGFFPGLDAVVVGMAKGDQKAVTLDPPADSENKNLAGKKVHFDLTLKSLKSVELPEIDAAFLEKLSGNIGSADELRTRIRGDLEREARRKAEEAFDEALQEAVLGLVSATPPAPLLEARLAERLGDFKGRFEEGYGFEDYLAEWGKTEEDVKGDLREGAEKSLRFELALDEIARREKLGASDDEVAERLRTLARMMRRSPIDVAEMVDSSGSRILEKQKITREKAFHWLRSKLHHHDHSHGHDHHDHGHDHDHDHEHDHG